MEGFQVFQGHLWVVVVQQRPLIKSAQSWTNQTWPFPPLPAGFKGVSFVFPTPTCDHKFELRRSTKATLVMARGPGSPDCLDYLGLFLFMPSTRCTNHYLLMDSFWSLWKKRIWTPAHNEKVWPHGHLMSYSQLLYFHHNPVSKPEAVYWMVYNSLL